MGYVRPRYEQLDKRLSRKAGMTLSELLVVLALSSIVLLSVALISTSAFRVTRNVNALIEIDEQISKLQSQLRYVASRHWSGVQFIDETTIYLWFEFPVYSMKVPASIYYDNEQRRLLLIFPSRSAEVQSDGMYNHYDEIVIAEGITRFEFMRDPDTNQNDEDSQDLDYYLYYVADFEISGLERKEIKGAVRIYY